VKLEKSILTEAAVGSAGLFVFGLVTIPLAGWVNGVDISMSQGAGMGVVFFGTRMIWLYMVRYFFRGRQ
jgi:hypothetical protein